MIRLLKMEITEENNGIYRIRISDGDESADILFSPEGKHLVYAGGGFLLDFLKSNEYQFRKLLHNKKRDSFYVGFSLSFSIIDGKDDAA